VKLHAVRVTISSTEKEHNYVVVTEVGTRKLTMKDREASINSRESGYDKLTEKLRGQFVAREKEQ
jgi:hypothetical protein